MCEQCNRMPKPLVNSRITYPNIHGRIIEHDLFLDQGVKQGNSPTFANLQLTGDATVQGNLYVLGNTTILDSNILEFQDNIILINRLETGSGVSLNQAGFEIERGTLENYRIVFNESDDTCRIGVISNTQAIATRQDNPLVGGLMIYNAVDKRLDASNVISIDATFTSTTNSTSCSTGTLALYGGLGISKDVYIDGTMHLVGTSQTNKSVIWTDNTNTLNITASNDIFLSPLTRVQIPFDKKLSFGSTDQSISSNSVTKDIDIIGKGNIFFTLEPGKRLSVPNQIPITFSTPSDKIYTDGSNNMVVESSQDILFTPAPNKLIRIPVDIGMAFANANQQISANLNNDLSIVAGSNIILTPGNGLDVRLPTDNGIKFGNSGLQRLYANSEDKLFMLSAGDIVLDSTRVSIPANRPLSLGQSFLMTDSTGNLLVSATGSTMFTNTVDATSSSVCSIYTNGGLWVEKSILSRTRMLVESDDSNSFIVSNLNKTRSTLSVNNSNQGNVSIIAGSGTMPSLCITNAVGTGSLIQLVSGNDATVGYDICRVDRTFVVNIPSYSAYGSTGTKPRFVVTTDNSLTELFSIETDSGNITSSGAFGLINTQDATNATTASFVVYGGLGVNKTIYTNGKIISDVSSTSALLIKSNDADVFNIDTITKQATLNASLSLNGSGTIFTINQSLLVDTVTNKLSNDFATHITNTADSTDSSNGALIVSGAASIMKKLRVSGSAYFNNGVDMGNSRISNLATPITLQDAATKGYVDLIKQGLFVKDSVHVATLTNENILTLTIGSSIDGYTLIANDRILIKNQSNPIENGIYVVQNSGSVQRAIDLYDGMSAAGVFVFVTSGDLNGSLGWICNSDPEDDIVGTSSLTFTQFTGLGLVVAGSGLSKTDTNQIDVNVDNSSLEIFDDALRIKNSAVGTGLTGGSGTVIQTVSDQSHVTKLGTIDIGRWQASTVQIQYGGTGRTQFTSGSIMFGGTSGINTSSKLFYNQAQNKIGLGTNQPLETLHLQSTDYTAILLNANSDGGSANARPEIKFAHTDIQRASIGVSRNFDDYATGVYPDSLVLSGDSVHFVTDGDCRVTIDNNGNIGINTSAPSAKLSIDGSFQSTGINHFTSTTNSYGPTTGAVIIDGGLGIGLELHVHGRTRFYNTDPSTSGDSGAVIIDGGLTVKSINNATNFGNGGALTVQGGASFGGDIYVTGEINGSGSSSSTFAYLTLTSTDEALNQTSGSLVTFGGITIQATANSQSIENGGALLVLGGASIASDLYIGGNTIVYGYTDFYSQDDNILNFYDANSSIKRFSVDMDSDSKDFSISRYDTFGSLVEHAVNINSSTGNITFAKTLSISSTSATSLSILGGQSIAKNLQVGGDLTVLSTTGAVISNGGIFVARNSTIGGTLYVDDNVTFNNNLRYKGNALLDTITNNNNNYLWSYFGTINTDNIAFTEIELSNGINGDSSPSICGTKIIVSVNGTNESIQHAFIGNMISTDTNKANFVVYRNNDKLHLFVKSPPYSTTCVKVSCQKGNAFVINNEGNSTLPDGTYSLFSPSWTLAYTTEQISNLKASFGDLTVEGSTMKVCDNLPIIGYNNSNTTESRNLGLLFERFQFDNDSGMGDIVSDNADFIDSIPNQSTASLNQIKLSNLANATDDYYNGWWVKIVTGTNINQVRKVISYNGSQQIATIDEPWTLQNPTTGDTVFMYGSHYVANYFDEGVNKFKIAFASVNNKSIQHLRYCDVQLGNLIVSDTTPSLNQTTGSIYTLGGLTINNTQDASSVMSGGTITTKGGAAIKKTLYVGDSVGIGNDIFTPSASIHIKKNISTMRFENDADLYGSIEFANNSTLARFGIVNDCLSNTFCLTYSSSGSNPLSSNKAFVLNSAGYIGIGINNTNNINTPLTIPNNNFISAAGNDGYLGIMSAPTNTNDSSQGARMLLYGNTSPSNSGNIQLYTGTNGSLKFYTKQDTERLCILESGVALFKCSTATHSKTSGALIVSGGLATSATDNATSSSNGGSFTVGGGAAIGKDVYIGGNIYVEGSVVAGGSVSNPSLTLSNTQGCTITSYNNTSLVNVSNQATFSFGVQVTPLAASENCQFEFNLPEKVSNLTQRSDVIGICSGYTDDTKLIPLFNTLVVGVADTTNAILKFQSVSTGIHYLTVTCRYNLS